MFFIIFSFLSFSGIETEPPVVGGSVMLVLIRARLPLIYRKVYRFYYGKDTVISIETALMIASIFCFAQT